MPDADARLHSLAVQYQQVRRFSETLCDPLEVEDYVVQSMPDVSPTKWHIAHTTWFFETFLLKPFVPGYKPYRPQYEYLFNSYYNGIGKQFSRPNRGLLSRPTVIEIMDYRHHIDELVLTLLASHPTEEMRQIVTLGLHHEQQHQELMLTDIKHVFSQNPLLPTYQNKAPKPGAVPSDLSYSKYSQQIVPVGFSEDGFCYDNETPNHEVLLASFELANRAVCNADVMAFIEAGGYQSPELWLSEGWNWVQNNAVTAPMYWQQPEQWHEFTLNGLLPVNPAAPACHLSLYEADAIARFFDARLPTEFEWEWAAREQAIEGNFADSGVFHPVSVKNDIVLPLMGDIWQWTSSSYAPYPGFKTAPGAVGEYNGKFMCNQYVLRGGSCVTSLSHIRRTYRNFFPADARWQFSGLRLARSV